MKSRLIMEEKFAHSISYGVALHFNIEYEDYLRNHIVWKHVVSRRADSAKSCCVDLCRAELHCVNSLLLQLE